jgi:superfamily II DNA helicase RecQ
MLEKLNLNTLLLEEEENDLNKLVASQSNHSISIEDLNYGRSSTSFSNINSNLSYKYLKFCLRYFSYFKLDQLDIQVESYKNQLSIRYNLLKEERLNIANSLAIKYSKFNSIDNLESSSSNTKKHSRQASSISSSSLVVNKKIKTLDLINLSSLDFNSNILTSLLQEFLQDNKASFRSLEQELLFKSILLKVPYILGVLPTSIGKSLIYLLTSSLSISKVTIVIIPLIGLKLDILRRAKSYNIPCNIYEDTKTFNNLTLVSIETIVSSMFISQVENLINSRSLDRIIIDEFHLLISSSSYRSIMFKVKELLLLKVQFVFLSGTLPYSFELELINTLYLNNLSIIRASCSKPNISYRTRAYISNKEEERVLEIKEYIESFKTKEFLSLEDKILIFCPSIQNIELVASILNCSYYNSSLSIEDKNNTLNSFLNSKEDYYNTLVTSSSLEEGFDYSFIRLVIYKDKAYSFLGFLQGSSRGGRDNRPSTSIFFYNPNINLNTSSTSNTNSISLLEQDKLLINKYLLEVTCRRRQISLYLDNKLIDSCSSIDNLCDLCFNRSNTINNQVNRVLESSKGFELERIKIRDYISTIVSKSCIYCSLLSPSSNSIEHNPTTCSIYSNIDKIGIEVKELIRNKTIILKENSCCFTCLLPTVLCLYLKKSNKCLVRNFMFRVLAILYNNKEELDLKVKYNFKDNITLKEFLNIVLSKVFIKELNTQGILGFYILVYNS